MVGVELPARNLSVQLIKTSMSLDCFAIMMYNACTLHVHVHTVYIHVHTFYMGTTYCIHIHLWYIPLCTALVIGMYYAIVQELVILCPATTLQAQASTWISVKPRSAANQALEARMWRRTPAQLELRNSQRHEKWLVVVELIQTQT